MNLLTTLTLLLSSTTPILASALDIKTTHSTSCTRKTTAGDTVHMHYRGRLADSDQEFDSSYKRGQPLKFPVGKGFVIRGLVLLFFSFPPPVTLRCPSRVLAGGPIANDLWCRWDEGLLDMCIGDQRTLTIPPEYGYGERGIGPIPGGATLVFETELVGIDGVAKDEL